MKKLNNMRCFYIAILSISFLSISMQNLFSGAVYFKNDSVFEYAEINEKSNGYDWNKLNDANKSKVCEMVNDAWERPYNNIEDLVLIVDKYYREIGGMDKTLFNVIESYILLKTKHESKIDDGLYAQIQEKRKKYVNKKISQGTEEKKSISGVSQSDSEIYNYLQDRWDFYKSRDEGYIPELHDDLALSDTANHFGISRDEVERIFNKVDQQKIDANGVDNERIDEIEKRTKEVLSGME